jgi:hypothetical protein
MYTHVHPLMHQIVRDRHARLSTPRDVTRVRRPWRSVRTDDETVHRLPTSS